jgi:DNA-binding ferritin-like protein
LLDANNLVLASLMMAYQEAEQATEIGLSNFLQDRVAAHQKHGWMLKSITK